MFLVRAGEIVNPNSSGLVSRLMEVFFLVGWANVEVMEGFHGKLYPLAEDWNINEMTLE